jgi:hypothetical protein
MQVQRLLERPLGCIAPALADLDLGQSIEQLRALPRFGPRLLGQGESAANVSLGLAPVVQSRLDPG